MAFTVEQQDGQGYIAGANAYASDTDADTYFGDRGIVAWTGVSTVKQAALVRATAYLDARYRDRCQGSKAFPQQALAWPRRWVFDREVAIMGSPQGQAFPGGMGYPIYGIPQALRQACFEAALIALSGDLMSASDRVAQLKSRMVGAIQEVYSGGPSLATYQLIDSLMAPLLMPAGRAKVSR